MDYIFENEISGIIESAPVVEIDETYYSRIIAFVEKITQVKVTEAHHRVDNLKESKRFSTGFLGEAALEKYLSVNIIDWTIGNSNKYHVPDVPGYNVGIKTVEFGKFPIIFKDNKYPQIICVINPKERKKVHILGLATVEILNEYQDDNLILDVNLRARGTKTGFYGLKHLEKLENIEQIEKYKKV